MENNIFIKNKKKFNPDINQKYSTKETERLNTTFDIGTNIYNPITNIIPDKVNSQNDLQIKLNNNINLKERIAEMERERNLQDLKYKPVQSKIIPDNQKIQNMDINTFNDLKNNSVVNKENKKYNNVLGNLKELGIL